MKKSDGEHPQSAKSGTLVSAKSGTQQVPEVALTYYLEPLTELKN